uniref:Uncharacterized protein n=1 Tax=Biomphalaria glabrata TaxID=6526 RepID=A0A2C9KED4_BIOGL
MMDVPTDSNRIQTSLNLAKRTLTTFPFSKTTCVCNCGKYKLDELPKLRNILPENYEYKLCEYLQLDREDKFLVTLRMTLSTKEEALEWKRNFEERSLTTHVKDKTYPNVERVSVFKAQYRCQFFDRRKNKKKLPEKSKFRDCHSILFINIKKYFRKTVDHHMPKYKMVVRLHYAHDHPLDTADVLKKRHLNEDIKRRFLEMFRQGMKPKDALDRHKKELLQSLGPEKYRQVVCDGYYVPNVPKIYRLYYQIHGKGVSAKTTTKRSSRHNPNPDWIAFQSCQDATNDEEGGNHSDYNEEETIDQDQGNNSSLPCQGMVVNPHCSVVSDSSLQNNILEHNINTAEMLDPKALTEQMGQPHVVLNHNDEIQKLAEADITYPNITAHNSVYNDLRSQQSLSMATSLFSDSHLGMGLFQTTQHPSWDNFSVIQQAAVMVNDVPAAHQNMEFQNPIQQSQQDNYMNISQTSCDEANFLVPQNALDHRLQSSLTRDDYDMLSSQHYTWPHDRIQQQSNPGHATDKVITSRYSESRNQETKKFAVRKYIQKRKKKITKELNMKHVTKKWMERKPKVEAETQNMASEVVQNILLADEADKLNVKLTTFFNKLKSKMSSDPKIFVPAVRSFILATENASDDSELVSFLKDFKKTEENILKSLQQYKLDSTRSCSSQTSLCGPVVKLYKIKPESKNKLKGRADTKVGTQKRCKSNLALKDLTEKTDCSNRFKNTLQSSNGKSKPLFIVEDLNFCSGNLSSCTQAKNLNLGTSPVHKEYVIQSSRLSNGLNKL